MSSLIEQAAQRLEQLRQAGVVIPEPAAPTVAVPQPHPPVSAPARAEAEAPARPPAEAPARAPAVQSKQVELDLDALAAAGFATPSAARSRIADQFRLVKRPLINNAIGNGAAAVAHGNLIMVTSAVAGEGKSFTSINLAMSIAAELDHTVMLVDADVARPSLLKMLGLPPAPGLLDLLESRADMSSVLLRTNIEKLTLLPSGTPHGRATELLASDTMRQLLDEMSTRYPGRIIIFDSPPLLLTTEARALAARMGQIVVVVQADTTLQSDVRHALATIESCPNKMLLLNQARSTTASGYGYSYSYGYRYGYGAESEKPAV